MRYLKSMVSLCLVFALLFVFTGCSQSDDFFIETVPETTAVTEAPTVAPTEAPTEPTYPEGYLGIEAGSYTSRYHCTSTGDYLDYYIHVPNNAVSGMPLVIFLHGDGEVDDLSKLENFAMIKAAREIYGEDYPFISLSPCTRVESWITSEISGTLMALIDYVVKTYEIDTEHIIITGHSRGAIGVWDMISKYGDYFSAAVPISSPHATNHLYLANCAKVSVWAFCGDQGERECSYHKPMQRNVNEINARGGTAIFTILKGLEHGPTKDAAFTQETFEWMLSQ